MKQKRLKGIGRSFVIFGVTVWCGQAATLYWDTNGTTEGSGNAGGIWDTSSTANWNATADGTGIPQTWQDGDLAIFSAGNDGVGTKTINLFGTVRTSSILLQTLGVVNLTGGVIDLTGGAIFDTSVLGTVGGRSATWSSDIVGEGKLVITGHGDLSDTGGGSNTIFHLNGANSFVGDVTISAGVVRADSNFGAASNKVILNGGGLIDNNLNLTFSRDLQVDEGFTGVYRTWGSVATGQITGAILGGGTLKHTDGGTLTLAGDGSAFTGTYNNVRGNTNFSLGDWAGTRLVNSDGSVVRFNAPGESTIRSYAGDRDVLINGSRLNVLEGEISVVSGAGINNFWIQGPGALTSKSGTLTLNWDVPFVSAGDQAIRVLVEDYDGATPLTVVKNGPGGLARYDQANTYTGGTVINGGRVVANHVQAFGMGTVTVKGDPVTGVGGQAWLNVGGVYANDFEIAGIGADEAAGNLGAIRFGNATINGSLTVSDAARVVAWSGGTGTFNGDLLGSGNLEINFLSNVSANGTIHLNGDASGYSGKIVVSRGRLNMLSDTDGSLLVEDTGVFAGENTFAGDLTLGSEAGVGGATLIADGTSSEVLSTQGNLTLNGVSRVVLSGLQAGENVIARYGGTLTGDESNLALEGGLVGYRGGSGFNTSTAGVVVFDLIKKDLTWTGSESAVWDVSSGLLNWRDDLLNAEPFFQGDGVIFDEAGNASSEVTIQGNPSPSSITVNSTTDYTIRPAGAGDFITGGGALLKDGASILTLAGDNSFLGGTVIRRGAIQIQLAGSLGGGSVILGDALTEDQEVALYLDVNRVNFGRAVIVSKEAKGEVILGSRSSIGGAADNNQFTNITLERDVVFDSNANDRTDYENIRGTGTITIRGNGRSIFPTVNPFVGDVIVSPTGGGSFQTGVATAGNQDRIPDTSDVTVNDTNNGSVPEWRISTGGETIAGLFGSGDVGLNSINGRLTVGANDADGNFSGRLSNTGANLLSLTKIGGGTQILSGVNGYTGSTVVNGGVLSLTSVSTLSPDGSIVIDGGVLDLDFVGVHAISALTLGAVEMPDGTYGAPGSGAANTSANFTGTGVLRVGDPNAYLTWEEANGITGAGPLADSDGDGIPNGIEFVIGGDPSGPGSDSSALAPTVEVSGDFLVFTFRRSAQSSIYEPFVQFGSDLLGWTRAEDAQDGVVILETNDGFGAGIDRVEVQIPRSLVGGGGKMFARLGVEIQ